MKQVEEKAGLAAPDRTKNIRHCKRCFQRVPDNADYCPECGATVGEGDGSDAAVYQELAKANLLKLRGSYKEAQDVCLAILRRYPNNGSANTLLGDISEASGDLEQAAQWYELALDLMPESGIDRQKLEEVREKIKAREAAQTAEELGLSPNRGKLWIFVAVAVGLILISIFAALALKNAKSANESQAIIVKPVDVPPDVKSSPSSTQDVKKPTRTPLASLTDLMKLDPKYGPKVLEVSQDPRTKQLILTFSASPNDPLRTISANLARTAFGQVPGALVITVRGVRDGNDVYVVDARRSLYEETLTTYWQSQHSNDPDAWVNHILTDEWMPSGTHIPDAQQPLTSEPQTPPVPAEPTATPQENSQPQ